MKRKVAFRKKRQNRLGMASVIIVVAMLCIVILVSMINLSSKQKMYIEREEQLNDQIAAEQQRALDLIEYEKYTKTSKYVEEVAKDRLGLVYGDEIIFQSGEEK
ncbi:MAG: septum formation initiator family protein [Lachnospiraceae bacterium]|nr:septum formation initiator family protein [Lachnospiraceae bacterium]